MSAAFSDIMAAGNKTATPSTASTAAGLGDTGATLEILLSAFPDVKDSTGDPALDQFAKEIARIILIPSPNLDRNMTFRGVKHLLQKQQISSEQGLSFWEESWLPKKEFEVTVQKDATQLTTKNCTAFTYAVVRKGFMEREWKIP